ncbi:MAG: efflux RND transporter permease subunit [Clostridia bacterium]|nr:efflux RND transporter permease subunit [Clostridia bacterium]
MSKFSVKKPMTVFVAVILVIVLGVVSFTSMTPNLLPNMDFPYVIIMTAYPGANPELVETEVTRPLEQALSVLDGVKQVTSTSADNYSTVALEYEDGKNMDSAMVDINSSINTLTGSWNDMVASPVIMKINPDMMPAAVVAVDVEGMDTVELSEYVSDTLLNQLEGVDGVASVSKIGSITESIHVVIDEKKLQKINTKIQKAIDDKFDEGKAEINDGLEKLNEGLEQTKEGQKQIEQGKNELETQRKQAGEQLSEAQNQLNEKQTELLNGKMQILNTLSALTTQRTQLQSTYEQIVGIQEVLLELKKNINEMTEAVTQMQLYQETAEKLQSAMELMSPESEEYQKALEQLETIENALKKMGLKTAELPEKIREYNQTIETLKQSLSAMTKSLTEKGFSEDTLQSAIDEMKSGIDQMDSAINQLNETLTQLNEGEITLESALAELNKQKDEATYQMNTAYVELRVNESTLASTQAQLETTKTELETTLKTVNEQQETTKDKSDVTKIITLDMVSGILTAQNFSMPAGYITDSGSQYLVRVGDKIEDVDKMKELLLFDMNMDGVDPIYLKDIANVFKADTSDKVYAKINGNNGVMLSFTKSSQSAVATVCDNLIEKLDSLQSQNSKFHYTMLMNQGDYINLVVNNVLQNLIVGAGFAIIVLFIFLKDIKPTIIVAFSIPISLVFAVVLMYFSGVTLNIISLSGLAVGVGMLVDNSVVVIENIYRLRSLGYSAIKASVNGARQVAGAITASTLTTVCVFLPIVFIEGVTRQIFTDLALTVTYSLLASLIVALTLVPAMGQSLFRKNKEHKQKFFNKMLSLYEKAIRFTLSHRLIAILLAFVLLVGSSVMEYSKGFSFMPEASSAEIQISLSMPKGSKMEDTVKTMEKMTDIVYSLGKEKYDTVGAMIGGTSSILGMGGGSEGSGSLYVVLSSEYAKDSQNISTQLSEKYRKEFDEETSISVSSGSMGMMSSMLTGSGIAVNIYCDDMDKLQKTANDIEGILKKINGIEKTDNGIADTNDEVRITVYKDKAMQKSLTVAQVFQQVTALVKSENTATSLTNSNGSSIDVIVIDEKKSDIKVKELLDKKLTYNDFEGNEKTITLGEISKIEKAKAMNSISRIDQKRYLTVTGTVSENYILTNVSNDVKDAVDKYEHSDDISIEFEGENETTMESVYDLLKMLLLGIIFIYLIMVAQFQSLKSPFIVMFTIPLAFTGGFLGLFFTGFDISVVSMIGFVMLCGIVVNNGIVLVDYINQLRMDGMEKREALVEAGKTRMRPILMTAITTIIGLISMALGIGEGTEMMQPVAIVCIFGLLYATIMTLFIVPVMYDVFNRKPMRVIDNSELEEIND